MDNFSIRAADNALQTLLRIININIRFFLLMSQTFVACSFIYITEV